MGEEKKIQRIVEGKVARRKKPLSTRFREMFLADADQSVTEYVIGEVLVPALKDMVTDAVSQGFERMIYGETRSNGRRARSSSNSGPFNTQSGHVPYNRYSSSTPSRVERQPTRRSRASHDFDEIILGSRAEAMDVISSLNDVIGKYEAVSIADLYEMVGVDSHFTDQKWGWTNLDGAMVRRISNGYLLDLPKTEQID